MAKSNRYPSYPDSNRDAAVKEAARIKLRPPNKNICLYCHAQAVLAENIEHVSDCPFLLDPKNPKANVGKKPTVVEHQVIGNYQVRLYKETDGSPYIIYSGHHTRLETLEYETEEAARSDFRLIISVIRNVLQCEGKKI